MTLARGGNGVTLSKPNGTQAQAEDILGATVDLAQQMWRDRLLAAYALGSLAHGGFRPLVSDVDIGLILADPLLDADALRMKELNGVIKATGRPFSDRLSIFWGSVASLCGRFAGGRFPPLDRLDLQKFGRLVRGRDVRGTLPSPTREELVVAGAEFALWRLDREDVIALLKDPRALLQTDPKTLTKLILYPVRFTFTARTGEVGRNDAAVEHWCSAAEGASSQLARLALTWRDASPNPSDTNAIGALAAGLLPLYGEFLEDHEARLRDYDRPDLADAFRRWAQKLQA
jgi:hypothetical protein